ncbi:unnamed protein product [Closterium sp. Yama58-4]|nr:unnamed protein product [Closterium sp. Yama58-4]
MAASPAVLLPLLALAIICAVATAHMPAGERGDPQNAGIQERSASDAVTARSLKSDTTATSGNESMRVGIMVLGVSLPVSFNALRCFSLPRAVRKGENDVQVWWHGLTGGSTGGSTGGGGSRGKDRAGAACKQVQFFASPACKGKALQEVLQPPYANLRRFFHVPSSKKIPQWTSVSCKADITCQHATCPTNSTCMPTTDGKGVTCPCNHGFAVVNGTCLDLCDAVNCGPGGNCMKDANGKPFCSCSTGFKASNDMLSCIDLCDAVKCGPGGNCTKDANGKPSCSCSMGFKQSSDELFCIDLCDAVNCGPGGNCKKDASGKAFCSCNTGFKSSDDTLSCIDLCDADGFKPSSDELSCIDNCDAVNCGPNGKCVRKENGDPTCACDPGFEMPPNELRCDSPCGTCPSGAACKTVHTSDDSPKQAEVLYCECPTGFGMTPTECKEGSPDNAGATSVTLFMDRSKPYTARLKNGCTQVPNEVVGVIKTANLVVGVGGAAGCFRVRIFPDDNCSSKLGPQLQLPSPSVWAFGFLIPPQVRSISCFDA